MNSEVQYLLLEWNKMLLFLVVHLSVYDVSYVHHCNNTSSSHSFAKLLKNTERAFPYQNGNNSCLFGANATHDSNREHHSQLFKKSTFHCCTSQPVVVNVNIRADKKQRGLRHFKAKKLHLDFKCWLFWNCFPPQISSKSLHKRSQELNRNWMPHPPRLP